MIVKAEDLIKELSSSYSNPKCKIGRMVKEGKYTPIIRASICTGEQVAGFLDNSTGKFVDIMVIRGEDEVEKFRQMYGIKGAIKKEY